MKTTIITIFGDSSTWGAFDLEKGGWVERLKIYFFERVKNYLIKEKFV